MQAVLLTLCAALFFAVGHALQKHGVSTRFRAADPSGATGWGAGWLAATAGQPVWLAGMGSILLASALDLQAVSAGDLTLVKPLLGLQAAFAVGIGMGWLGERVGRGEGAAIATLLVGAGLVAITTGPTEIRESEPWSSAGIFGVSAAAAAALGAAHVRAPGRLRGEIAFGLAAGLLFGVSDFMMKRATSHVAIASGGFSVVDPVSLWSLVKTPEVLWIATANVGAFFLMQLAYMRGRIAVISPLASLSGTAFAVGLGFSVLEEPLSPARAGGIVLVLAATGLLVRAGPADNRPGARPSSGDRESGESETGRMR
jgi:drug/metabolite transporter (DMT)-like permease